MFRRLRKLNSLYNSKLGYEEKYFVDEQDRGIIDVGAEHYDDLFSYYDMDGKSILDQEFISFIEMKADSIPINKELSLCFHVPEANEDKRLEIEKTLKDTYIKQTHIITRKIKEYTKFSLAMLLIGLIFIPIVLLTNSMPDSLIMQVGGIISEICAWIFIWEAIDSYFLSRRDLQDELLMKYRFVQAKVTIKEYYQFKEKKVFSKNVKTLSNIIKNSNITHTEKESESQNLENNNQLNEKLND